MRNIILILLFIKFLGIEKTLGQVHNTVQILIPPDWNIKNLDVNYDDGCKIVSVPNGETCQKIEFKYIPINRYTTLNITYKSKRSPSISGSFFVYDNRTTVDLTNQTDSINYSFKNPILTNAITVWENPMAQKRNEFLAAEISKMNSFWSSEGRNYKDKDSLIKVFHKLLISLNKREQEFVYLNKDEDFGHYLFRSQVVNNTFIAEKGNIDAFKKLLVFFDTTFSSRYKNSPEGRQLRNKLLGKINTKIGSKATDFSVKDINGNELSLTKFKGRYLLLVFWATWCPPCMQEIPVIKHIRNKYDSAKLSILSVSADRDFGMFKKVINEKDMDWFHVYGNNSITQGFGVESIPAIFLINGDGIIEYSSSELPHSELEKLLNDQL